MKSKITFLAVLMMVMATPQSVRAYYDFSAVSPSGHTICYIANNSNRTALVVNQQTSLTPAYINLVGDVIIPSNVTYNNISYRVVGIAASAFTGCDSITSMQLPSTINSIGSFAFSNCSSLMSIAIPSGVTAIQDYTFEKCFSLSQVSIPSTVTSIGTYAFDMCYGIMSLYVPSSVTTFGTSPFFSVNNVEYHGTVDLSYTQAKTINGYVEGNFVFFDNSKTKITGCNSSVRFVEIPLTVTGIGKMAFRGCSLMDSIVLPPNLSYIEASAFSKCFALKKIISQNKIAPTLYNEQYCSNCFPFYDQNDTIPIVIPCDGVVSYQTEWDFFVNFIPSIPKWSVMSEDTNMGCVVVLHEPTCDDTILSLYAIPSDGYVFLCGRIVFP